MTRPSDETLMAFADGALPPDEHARVAALIDNDPEARATVELYRRSSSMVRGAYDDALRAPPPATIIDMIMREPAVTPVATTVENVAHGSPGTGATAEGKVVPFAPRAPRRLPAPGYRVPLAAALALTVGLATGWSLGGIRGPDAGGVALGVGAVPAQSRLATLLETKPSYAPLISDFNGTPHQVMVVATFSDRLGRNCREVEVAKPDQSGQVAGLAVACRQPSGQWSIEGASLVASAPESTAVKPASGLRLGPVESILQGLGASGALSPAEEKALVERRWK